MKLSDRPKPTPAPPTKKTCIQMRISDRVKFLELQLKKADKSGNYSLYKFIFNEKQYLEFVIR